MRYSEFWAIKSRTFGFYCGTYLTRRAAIAAHVEGRFRWHDNASGRLPLTKAQKDDWLRCRRNGDSAVKVRVEEIP